LLEIAGETTVEEPGTDEWMNVHKADNGKDRSDDELLARK
jgi:hypothetical protein